MASKVEQLDGCSRFQSRAGNRGEGVLFKHRVSPHRPGADVSESQQRWDDDARIKYGATT
jgi:hypothetical protein